MLPVRREESPIPRRLGWRLALFVALAGLASLSARAAEYVDPSLAEDFPGTRTVWVFFSDKDVSAPAALDAARTDAAQWVTERAKHRRALRGVAGREAVLPCPALVAADAERDFPVSESYVSRVKSLGARVRIASRWFNAVSAVATSAQVRALARLPFVLRIEPVAKGRRPEPEPIVPAPVSPIAPIAPSATGPSYGGSLAQLQQINVVAAHSKGYTGTGVVVGILDTGFYRGHQCLVTRGLIAQHDFVFDDDDTQYDPSTPGDYSDSHGTAVWSVLGGFKNGSLVGVAYHASFILGKTEVVPTETPIEEDYWVAGIEWMESLGADVVNSSLSYPSFYTYSQLDGRTAKTTIAAEIASSLGVVVCNSNGNSGPGAGTLGPPADGFLTLGIGGVNADGSNWSSSSRGPTADGRIKPDVCARGSYAFVAREVRPGTTYGYSNGTSFASPLVAGAAALVVQAHPDWTVAQIRRALMETASRHNTPGNTYGWGIVNVLAAIRYETGSPSSVWQIYE